LMFLFSKLFWSDIVPRITITSLFTIRTTKKRTTYIRIKCQRTSGK
jgi:hypothetical protein